MLIRFFWLRAAAICAIFLHLMPVFALQEVSFETVATLRMRSFGLDFKNSCCPEQRKIDPNEINNQALVKEALAIKPSDDDRRQLVYQICIKDEQKRGFNAGKDDQSLKTVLEDLDVYFGCGQDSQETIFNRLFDGRLVTMFGEAMATKRLAKLEVDPEKLARHQDLIALFGSNDVLSAKVDTLLQQVKESETNMLSFWQEEHPLVKELIKGLYFGKYFPAKFNKQSAKLELLTRLNNCKLAFAFGGDFVLNIAMMYGVKKLMGQSTCLADATHDALAMYNPKAGIDEIRFQSTPEGYQARDVWIKSRMAATGNTASPQEIEQQHSSYKRLFCFLGGFKSAMSILNIYNKVNAVKMFVADIRQKRDTANFLQERLISVSTYIRALKQVYELAKQYPELSKDLPIMAVCKRVFTHGNDDFHQLVELLLTDTFKGSASFFSRTGRVLAAYSLMQACKDEFVELMKLLGSLDAALATAKLYRKFEDNNRATYSFAGFCDADEPSIRAIEFWNPLIDHTIAVTNNIALGGSETARAMVLTGSNKGGKSTALKSIMEIVWLSQTLTIVPAQEYCATPFSYLCTYMNVSDDTAAGRSLFQAQVGEVKKLVKSIGDLDKTEFGFIVIDEAFNGTGALKAGPAAYKLAKSLSQSSNLCFIFATHFIDELSKLEEDTQGVIVNYKVDGHRLPDGTLEFNHKLEPGVSSCNVADDILQHELSDIIFEDVPNIN